MKSMIWAEKFRPSKLKQLILPPKTRRAFEEFIEEKQIPNIILYGPPGSGKTTLSLILLKELADRKLTLNASSGDRGVATVKQKIKQFASTQRSSKKKLNIVLLDEADGLTVDAQLALKGTMDSYQANCRFIFTANQFDKINEAIVSRCILFEFNTFKKQDVVDLAEKILKAERIEYRNRIVEKIVNLYYPDVRTIINNLQLGSVGGKLQMADMSLDTNQVMDFLKRGKITKLRELWKNRVDFIWVYKYLFNGFIIKHMPDEVKPEAAVVVADYLYKDKGIADKEINCTACCIELMSLLEVNIDFKSRK